MNVHQKSFGGILRQARATKNLRLQEVANALGVSKSAVSQWESGKSGLTGASLFNIARLLNIDLAKPGLVQPLDKALPEQETREGEVRTAVDPSRVSQLPERKVSDLREQMEEVMDLLHAIDKVGDGIGGADGYAVSAVALSAKMIADNVLHVLKVVEGSCGSSACACEGS